MTNKQHAFVEAMSDPTTKTGEQAAIRAGYSEKSARVVASRLLKNEELREAIELRKAKIAEFADLKAATIIGSACIQAFGFSIADCIDDAGHFDVEKATRTGAIHFVKSLTRRSGKYGESVSLEMYSMQEARQELAGYLGLRQKALEKDDKLDRVVGAILAYLDHDPNANRQFLISAFAQRHGFSAEEISERMNKKH